MSSNSVVGKTSRNLIDLNRNVSAPIISFVMSSIDPMMEV